MKRINSLGIGLILIVGALFLGSANQSAAGPSEYSRAAGCLRMKHSPVLGINIPIAVWIDGVQAGAFAKGHVYERCLTPGRHDIYARRPGRISDSYWATLDVRPGETYSFVVKCTFNRVILDPVARVE